MVRYQQIPLRARQIIRVRVAERRRVPLSEVPFPRSNLTFYQYLFECEEIPRNTYEDLVVSLIHGNGRVNHNIIIMYPEHPTGNFDVIFLDRNRTL